MIVPVDKIALCCLTIGLYISVLLLGGFFLLFHPWNVEGDTRHPLLCRVTMVVMFIGAADMLGWVIYGFVSYYAGSYFMETIPYPLFALDFTYFCCLTMIGEVLVDPHKRDIRVVVSYLIPTVIIISVLMFVQYKWMLCVSFGAMCIYILSIMVHQLVLIHRREQVAQNYYSEKQSHSYAWFYTAVGLMVVQLGMYIALMVYSGILLNLIYAIFSSALWIYITVCVVQVVPDAYRIDIEETSEDMQEEVPVASLEEPQDKAQEEPSPDWVNTLNTLMDEQKPYTDSNLNITMLARMVGTNRTYLSMYISKTMHTSFYEYINQYRLRYVINLMKTGDPSLKLETIATMSGFISGRAMRSVFLQKHQCTPNEYRARLQAEQPEPSAKD